MSAAILLAEATLLPRGVNLSLFSILINSVKKEEVLVQVNFSPFFCFCYFIFLKYEVLNY